MNNQPDKIPQGTVSRYKTSFLTNEAFRKQAELLLEDMLLHKRFYKEELETTLKTKISLGGNDIDAVNLADFDLMCEYMGYDVDLYCLIDRYGQFYITEIAVNNQ